MNLLSIRVYVVWVFLCKAVILNAFDLVGSQADLVADRQTRVRKLPNQFSYYLRQVDGNRVQIRFVVKAGFENERSDQLELAHVVEHLAMRKTEHFHDVRGYLESKGLAAGIDYNAFTSFQATTYMISIPGGSPELLRDCIRLVSDWAHGRIAMDTASINAEKGVVLQELGMNYSRRAILHSAAISKVVGEINHNGRINVDTRRNVSEFKRHSLVDFYSKWYVPDRESLMIVGDIDVAEVERQIVGFFSDLKSSDISKRIDLANLNGKSAIVGLEDESINTFECKVILKGSCVPFRTHEDFNENLCAQVFSQLLQFRLTDEQAYSAGHFSGIVARFDPVYTRYGKPFSAISISFDAASESEFFALFSKVLNALYCVREQKINNSEFTRAKTIVLKMFEPVQDISRYYLDQFNDNFDRGSVIMEYDDRYKLAERLLSELKVESCREIFRKFSFENNRDVVIMSPLSRARTGAIRDEVDKIAGSIDSLFNGTCGAESKRNNIKIITKSEVIDRFQSATSRGNGVVALCEDLTGHRGLHVFHLSNGIEVVFNQEVGPGEEGVIKIVRKGNIFSDLCVDSVEVFGTIDAALGCGLGVYDGQDWRKLMQEENVLLGGSIIGGNVVLYGSASKSKLELLFLIFSSLFQRSVINSASWDEWKREMIDQARALNAGLDPSEVYQRMVIRESGSFSFDSAEVNELESISFDHVDSVISGIFENYGNLRIIVCGDYDVSEIRLLISRYLSPIAVKKKSPAICRDLGNVYSGSNSKRKLFFGGKEDVARVDLFFPVNNSDRPESEYQMHILRNEIQGLLITRLRQKEGVTFDCRVFVQHIFSKHSKYRIAVTFDCPSSRIYEVVGFVKEEMDGLKDIDLQKKILPSAKEKLILEMEAKLPDPFFLSEYWVDVVLGRYEDGFLYNYRYFINNVDVFDMITLSRDLDIDGYSLFSLMPDNRDHIH